MPGFSIPEPPRGFPGSSPGRFPDRHETVIDESGRLAVAKIPLICQYLAEGVAEPTRSFRRSRRVKSCYGKFFLGVAFSCKAPPSPRRKDGVTTACPRHPKSGFRSSGSECRHRSPTGRSSLLPRRLALVWCWLTGRPTSPKGERVARARAARFRCLRFSVRVLSARVEAGVFRLRSLAGLPACHRFPAGCHINGRIQGQAAD